MGLSNRGGHSISGFVCDTDGAPVQPRGSPAGRGGAAAGVALGKRPGPAAGLLQGEGLGRCRLAH